MSNYPSFASNEQTQNTYVGFAFDLSTKETNLIIRVGDTNHKAKQISGDLVKIDYTEKEVTEKDTGKKRMLRQHILTFRYKEGNTDKHFMFNMGAGKGYWRSMLNSLCELAHRNVGYDGLRIEVYTRNDLPSIKLHADSEFVGWHFKYEDMPQPVDHELPNGDKTKDYREMNRFLKEQFEKMVLPSLQNYRAGQAPAPHSASDFDDFGAPQPTAQGRTIDPLPPIDAGDASQDFEDDLPF